MMTPTAAPRARRRPCLRDVNDIRSFIAALPPFDSASLAARRASYDRAAFLFPLPDDVTVETIKIGAVLADRLSVPPTEAGSSVLYLHGGAYTIGSLDSHRHLGAAVARATEGTVLLLNYRLAPEHPFPAALTDALAAYRFLLERESPSRIVFAGDSAGGGLAVATMLAAREEGLPLPAAAALIAPWVDLSCETATCHFPDPLVNPSRAKESADFYLAGCDPRTPLASPLFGNLRGLPPMLIQATTEEVLLGDACAFDRAAREQGVRCTLELTPNMVHVWHWFAPILREGREAIARMADFIRKETGNSLHCRLTRSAASEEALGRTVPQFL